MGSRTTSELWNHFNKVSDVEAKCKYCFTRIKVSRGSTSNLSRHMKTRHVLVPVTREDPSTAHVQSTSEPTTSQTLSTEAGGSSLVESQTSQVPVEMPTLSSRQGYITEYLVAKKPLPRKKIQEIDDQLTKAIVKGYHPFKIVEEEDIKVLFKMLNPGYTLPSRKTISESLINQKYFALKDEIQKEINLSTAVCLTTDGWTSINNDSFIAITAHFLSAKTELRSFLLGCIPFGERHTAQNIYNFLNNEISAWGLTQKVVAIVSDNAANVTAAIQFGNWRHLTCFGHSLNLIVQAGLKEIKAPIEKIKAIVRYFHHSSTATNKLREVQKQMNLPELKLKQDVVTRWNSTYDMFNRILQIKEAVISTLALMGSKLDMLTTTEWEVIGKATELLKIFDSATTDISSEKSISLSKVILFSNAMLKQMDKVLSENILHTNIKTMATVFQEKLLRRFSFLEENDLAAQASILDPRIKQFGFSSDAKYNAAKEKLSRKVCSLETEQAPSSSRSSEAPSRSDQPGPSSRDSSVLWADVERRVQESRGGSNPTAAGIIELQRYLDEPMEDKDSNPLTWWENRKLIYPRLYKIVLRRHCIMATSVPCERIFSKAGSVITE